LLKVIHPLTRETFMRSILRAALAVLVSVLITSCAMFRSHEAATSAYVGDSAITARVTTALIKDPRIKANEIEVQTSEGRVTLNGLVDSAEMARRALEIARTTPGVRTIDDKLQVARTEASSVRQAERGKATDAG
jgi:hypothetical protein